MPNYFVRFTAHIDERKRPEGFPHEVYVDQTYENVEGGAQQIRQIANQRFLELAMANGLVVLKKQGETLEQELVTFDKRIYVPWHMITYMHMQVNQLVEEQNVKAPDPIAPELPPDKPTAQVN
jgi:hypothetical protein